MTTPTIYTTHDVKTIVLQTFTDLRLKPPTSDREAFDRLCELYVEDLAEFSEQTLRAGVKRWRRDWKYVRWPTIGEIRDHMQAVRSAELSEKIDQQWSQQQREQEERDRLHDEELARQAPEQRDRITEGLKRIATMLRTPSSRRWTEEEARRWCYDGVWPGDAQPAERYDALPSLT